MHAPTRGWNGTLKAARYFSTRHSIGAQSRKRRIGKITSHTTGTMVDTNTGPEVRCWRAELLRLETLLPLPTAQLPVRLLQRIQRISILGPATTNRRSKISLKSLRFLALHIRPTARSRGRLRQLIQRIPIRRMSTNSTEFDVFPKPLRFLALHA